MAGTAPPARSAPSLQDLIAIAWAYDVHNQLNVQHRVVRLAAQMALDEGAIPVEVEDWDRVIWVDAASGDPIPPNCHPLPAEVGDRARAKGQEYLEAIRRVAEGEFTVEWGDHTSETIATATGEIDGEAESSWLRRDEFRAIALKYERATEAVLSELGDWSRKTPWDVIADQVIMNAQRPGLTIEELAAYSNAIACDELPLSTTDVSVEVARLNASGLGERLQAELVERFADELPAELRSVCVHPEGAEDASKTAAVPETGDLDAGATAASSTETRREALQQPAPPVYVESAYRSYILAEQRAEKEISDREAYYWLKEHGTPDYRLPAFKTWQKYVTAGRKYYGTQKNTPRAGRTSRSAVPLGEH